MGSHTSKRLGLGLLVTSLCLHTVCAFSHDIGEESHKHTPADATSSTANRVEPETTEFSRTVLPLSVGVYEKLVQFQELLEAHETDIEKLSEAQRVLDDLLLNSEDLNATELGWIHRCYTMVAHKLDDLSMLIEHFTKLLNYRQGIEYEHEFEALEKLSQLLYSVKKHDEALVYANQLLDLNDSDVPGTILIAQINLALGKLEEANSWSRTALDLMHKEQESVDENSGTKILSVIEELEEWNLAVDVLEMMVTRFPRKQYWTKLGELYTELGNSEKATKAFEFATEIQEDTHQLEPE